MTIPDGYMQDADGRLVPIETIRPETLLEDELVKKLVSGAEGKSAELRTFYGASRDEVRSFLDLVAQQYGVSRGGRKGNITLVSFDGRYKVHLAIGETITFGAELQAAKALIDECLSSWSETAGAELKVIVLDAFRVNKEGKIDVDAVLGLRRHDFADPRWKRAMEAISDSIRVTRSKEYLRFYRRPAPDAEFVQVPLDIAKMGGPANV